MPLHAAHRTGAAVLPGGLVGAEEALEEGADVRGREVDEEHPASSVAAAARASTALENIRWTLAVTGFQYGSGHE